MLPMLAGRESLSTYLQKLENLLTDLALKPEALIPDILKLAPTSTKPLQQLLEDHLESSLSPMNSSQQQHVNFSSLRQRLETFKLMD